MMNLESMLLRESQTLLQPCENMGPSCGQNVLFLREARKLDFLCEISWFLNIGLKLLKILRAKVFCLKQNTFVGRIWPMIPVYKISSRLYPKEVHMTCYNWGGFKARARGKLPLVLIGSVSPVVLGLVSRGEKCVWKTTLPLRLFSGQPGSRVLLKVGMEWPREKLAGLFKQQSLFLSHPSPTPGSESKIYGCKYKGSQRKFPKNDRVSKIPSGLWCSHTGALVSWNKMVIQLWI